jgi:hypothetical protein
MEEVVLVHGKRGTGIGTLSEPIIVTRIMKI